MAFKVVAFLAVLVGVAIWSAGRMGNLLSGFTGASSLSMLQLQVVISGFCVSPVLTMLEQKADFKPDEAGDTYDFDEEGDINEEDYTKDSIYAILYSLYQAVGKSASPSGVDYQFTFNTWGFTDVAWIAPESDPQRHGKAAYQGLVEFEDVKEYIKKNPAPTIVEIGCGTGAGANHISNLIPGSRYIAMDMQQAAIDTCNNLHAKYNNRLECRLVAGGVGNNGNRAPMNDSSVDILVISETHIAEATIGPEEEAIFQEIVRILKPGGFFVWGNALPTSVWHMAKPVLEKAGFRACGNLNHTQGAVKARVEDEQRVNMFVDHMIGQFPVFDTPRLGQRCSHVVDRLLKNFYRHPGTALYLKMVTGAHSYMHQCWRKDGQVQF